MPIFHVTCSEANSYTVHVEADSLEDVEQMDESEFEYLERFDETSNFLSVDNIEDPDGDESYDSETDAASYT
tara:strand:+ start:190 stop:405 length:216 start_codon:yes stop_codon:yes gene_type:complete